VQILAGVLTFRHRIIEIAMIKRLCAVLLATAGLFIDARLGVLALLFLVALVLAHQHLRVSRPDAGPAGHSCLLLRAGYPRSADESDRIATPVIAARYETTNRVPRRPTGSYRT
jgi:hypothetical protein